jgi:hypothetical protein
LKAIIIPETLDGLPVTVIGESAFAEKGLTSVTLPNSVSTIGKEAFAANKLTSVSIPDSVSTIGEAAFLHNQLTSVIIPDSVSTIGGMAFADNQLTSVSIPHGVTTIGDMAFYNNQLTSVIIPDSVTSIGESPFARCTGLADIAVEPRNERYASSGGVLFNKTLTTLIQYPAGKKEDRYAIPAGVTSIGDWAFVYCTGLTSVSVPAGVTSIGNRAIERCTGLVDIAVEPCNERYTSLDGVLFNKTLTTLIQYPAGKKEDRYAIPAGVTIIEYWAFYGCTGLTSVSIPAGVTSIGGVAFSGCAGLTSVSIPAGVTSIGEGAFEG